MTNSRREDPPDDGSPTISPPPTPSTTTASTPGELPKLAENALLKQPGRGPGRPFEKGQSGNPAGRPPGSHNQIKAALQELLEQNLEAVLGTALQLALDGNLQAIKFLFSHLPQERERLEVALPQISSMADIIVANNAVFSAVSAGQLSLGQGKMLRDLLTLHAKTIESVNLERGIAKLEALYAEVEAIKSGK